MSVTPDFFERVRPVIQPQPHPTALIVKDQARFTVLTARLIRLEWAENGRFEDRATFAFPSRYTDTPPAFSTRQDADFFELDTAALKLRYRTGSQQPFSADNLSITLQLNGQPVEWKPGTVDRQNLRGTRRTLDECVGDVALEEGLLSRSGWSLFDDTGKFVFTDDGWVAPRHDHHQQDWYFFGYGHDYKAALQEYTAFGGQIPLIPRFVLGAWWSRYWAYSDQDLKEIAQGFNDHDLPLDVLVIDMDWHTTDSWTGYTWNRELFPDPPAFLKWVHDRGLRTTLNLHPAEGVQAFEQAYPAFAQKIQHDSSGKKPIPFRVGDKDFVQHYFELLHHPLEEQGVDFWWMDWQQGNTSEIAGLDPLPWLNHLHFADSTRRGSRAMLYSRWGGLGNHRYHIGFSGDTHAVWEALQFQPYFTATASNVCYGWWSHDIGGHVGPTEPELYARWVQFGAVNPCLRLHSTKDPLAERRPWAFSKEVFRASRSAFQFRYQLVPYIYTMARAAMDTSISLCRPMYYEYPEQEAAYVARYQYFLGDSLIAAPIVHPADPITGLATADVWVPAGRWYEFFTGESFEGPRWVRLTGDLDRMPLLVKAGSIIPLAPLAVTTDDLPRDRLILKIFPGPTGSFRLYEDDGISEAYHRQQEVEWTLFAYRQPDAKTRLVEISPVEGHCPALPETRAYEIHFEGSLEPETVKINGQTSHDWRYDPASRSTLVRVPEWAKKVPVAIEIVTTTRELNIDGLAHNRQLQQAEVKRLLGEHLPSVGWEAMPDALLTLAVPGRMDALARSGGPLVHFIEYATPEEAARQLGSVIIGGPASGEAGQVAISWRLAEPGGEKVVEQKYPVGRVGLVVYCPFAVEDADQPRRWTAEVKLDWHGHSLNFRHQSQPLSAAIARWQVVVYNEKEQPLSRAQLVGPEGQLNSQLGWEIYRPDFNAIKSVSDPYYVRLRERYTPRIRAGEPLASYAVATFDSPVEREAVIEFRSGGPIEFYLNDQPIEILSPAQEIRPYILFHQHLKPRATFAFKLHKGQNRLVVASRPPSPIPFWWFSAALVATDGNIMTDLHFK